MSYPVYHFTDTLHLPWIVESGELRPNLNRLKGIGDIEYLWATTNPDSDKTARALIKRSRSYNAEDYEFQKIQVVRFTLPSAGFIPWRDIKRKSTWTKQQIEELEATDRKFFGEHGQVRWRCRRKPLPLSSILKVEAKLDGYDWRPIKATRRYCHYLTNEFAGIMVSHIHGFDYYSTLAAMYRENGMVIPIYELPDRDDLTEAFADLAEDNWTGF